MAKVFLHGALAEFAPGPLQLNVSSPAEAVRALLANCPGIGPVIRRGTWNVVRGAPDTGLCLDASELSLGLGRDTELHFLPVVAGSQGAGKAILGAVIMVAAIVVAIPTGGVSTWGAFAEAMSAPVGFMGMSYGSIAAFGAAMLLGGISQMLAPTPKRSSGDDQLKSYMFNGPTNRTEQGCPVPVIYGHVRAGSICIASSISADDVAPTSTTLTGTASAPVISPSSAAAEPHQDAAGTWSIDSVDFAVSSRLADAAGYIVTQVHGGTVIAVTAGGESPLDQNGAVFANPLTLRFRPTLTPYTVTIGGGTENGAAGYEETRYAFAGGNFIVQAINAQGAGIGQGGVATISGYMPGVGWSVDQNGEPGNAPGPGDGFGNDAGGGPSSGGDTA